MFDWWTQRRRMVGGLYFGSPGWAPEGIENAPVKVEEAARKQSAAATGEDQVRVIPQAREDFAKLLQQIGLGRASAVTPGLHAQMAELGTRKIRVLMLNLLPTQPEFAMAAGLTRAALDDMMHGLAAIQGVVKARRVMVVTDRHDWRTRRLWRRGRRAAAQAQRKARLKPTWTFDVQGVLNQYPLAHPTLLLRRFFGKRLPVGRLPVRVNRMIVDPVTCWGLGRWMRTGQRFSERPVQLFRQGEKEGTARLVMGIVGETVESLCGRFGIPAAGMQVIVNGMLAGEEIDAARTRIETWTESVSVRQRPAPEIATPCFACGWCVDVCPTGLNPVSLLTLADEALRAGGAETSVGAAELRSSAARESLHCIGCGLCSYVCPTRLPLTQRTLRLRGWVDGNDIGNRPIGPAASTDTLKADELPTGGSP